jgi:hypothetical protein
MAGLLSAFYDIIRKLPVKNDGKSASSEHINCSMAALFLIGLPNPSTGISVVTITEKGGFKN